MPMANPPSPNNINNVPTGDVKNNGGLLSGTLNNVANGVLGNSLNNNNVEVPVGPVSVLDILSPVGGTGPQKDPQTQS